MCRVVAIIVLLLFSGMSVYSGDYVPSFALENALTRKMFAIDTIGALHINVFEEKDFKVAETHRPIVFELHNNVVVSSPIRFLGRYPYYIKGNGFSIMEKNIYALLISSPYQAKSWTLDKEKKLLSIKLKESIDLNQFHGYDSINVVYESWYRRFKGKMISINDSVLTFLSNEKILSNNKYLKLTPCPYFYLEAPRKKNIGRLLFIDGNSKMLIENTIFCNSSECAIVNSGCLKVINCVFRNLDEDGIRTSGELYVETSKFININSYSILSRSKTYIDVSNCEFNTIGMRGDNCACICTRGNAYIANNKFIDFNYSAIRGGHRAKNQEDYPKIMVENNIFLWTPEWEQKMKIYGLTDGGAIYISTCNKRAIVRHNTILNFGGHGHNRAVYCDDGAFNVSVYGNVIKGTRNSYDIDSRDCSKKWKRDGCIGVCPNTGNYIAYNICDGKLKLEGASAIRDNGCVFENNVIVGRRNEGQDIISNIRHTDSAIEYDLLGSIDIKGKVRLKKARKKNKSKAPSLK